MKADLGWVRLRRFEVELALEAAFESGQQARGQVEVATWGSQTQAYANGVEVHKKAEVEAARREVLATNLKVLDAAARTASAAGQTVEALARLVDNMGRLG